jgi:hypothetical protein
MNWVEKDHLREQAIEAQAEIIWQSLCAVHKEAVDTFNRLYRESANKLEYKGGNGSPFFLSLQVRSKGRGVPKYSTAQISFDRKRYLISCKSYNNDSPEVTISFEADADPNEDGQFEVFLLRADGQRIKNEESASRLLLGTFLRTIRRA